MTNPATTAVVGDTLPPLSFGPITRTKLALYAGASGDHNPIHIDLDFVKKAGLEDVFAHGMLSMAQLGRIVTNWAGAERLAGLSTKFTSITPVNSTVTVSAEVIERLEQDGGTVLRIALQAKVDTGAVTLAGEALVSAD